MNRAIYLWYLGARDTLQKLEKDGGRELDDVMGTLKETIRHIDESSEAYKRAYDRTKALQASFSDEQKDFICAEIGHWYLSWKSRMGCEEHGQHRLGMAKEELKILLLGDGE